MTSSIYSPARAQRAVVPAAAASDLNANGVGASQLGIRPRRASLSIACAACVAMLPLAGLAELSNDSLIGPGMRSRPAYDGSQSQRTELVAVIRHFGQPWFIRTTQGVLEAGARTELVPGLHAGAQLAYEPGRNVNESIFLQNHQVAGINGGASVGLHVEWDHFFGRLPVTVLARIRKDIDSDRGAQADLRVSAGVFHYGPVNAGVFAQATWADATSTGALYGLTPQQSARTGLPAFQPGSGRLFTSTGLLWGVDLSPRWIVVGSLESRRVSGDAAHSPLVEQRSNRYVSVGVAYRY